MNTDLCNGFDWTNDGRPNACRLFKTSSTTTTATDSFVLVSSKKTWADANNNCPDGLSLTTICSEKQAEAVLEKIGNSNQKAAWIGQRMNSNGIWRWISGATCPYENWHVTQGKNARAASPACCSKSIWDRSQVCSSASTSTWCKESQSNCETDYCGRKGYVWEVEIDQNSGVIDTADRQNDLWYDRYETETNYYVCGSEREACLIRDIGCQTCEIGKTQPLEVASNNACIDCGKGKFAINAETYCKNCDAGKANEKPENNAYSCKSCLRGQYQEQDGKNNCFHCSNGKFTNTEGRAR